MRKVEATIVKCRVTRREEVGCLMLSVSSATTGNNGHCLPVGLRVARVGGFLRGSWDYEWRLCFLPPEPALAQLNIAR